MYINVYMFHNNVKNHNTVNISKCICIRLIFRNFRNKELIDTFVLTFDVDFVQLLNALQLFGANLDDYLHLLLPPVVKLFDSPDVPLSVKRSVIYACTSKCTNILHCFLHPFNVNIIYIIYINVSSFFSQLILN